MKIFYACCDANGLISKKLEANTVREAIKELSETNPTTLQEWIADCETDLEDDSDSDCADMEFGSALTETGAEFEFSDNDVYGAWQIWSLGC